MLPRLRIIPTRGLILWASLCAALLIGLLVSLSHLMGVPTHESLRANAEQQRVIIDPVTGTVSGLSGEKIDTSAFDVAATEETVEEDTPATAETGEEKSPEAVTEVSSPADKTLPADLPRLRESSPITAIPLVPRTAESLVAAPAPEVTEIRGKRSLPIKNKDGTMPAKLYARPFTHSEGQHLLSIVITDVGFSEETLTRLIKMPGAISIGISPYASEPKIQIEALRNAGHEVWTMLPVQGERYPLEDPGPLGLLGILTEKETITRVDQILEATLGSVGVILPAEEAISHYAAPWNTILATLEKRGIRILAAKNTQDLAALTGKDATRKEMVVRADMQLDSTPSAAFIRSKLSGLKEQIARQDHFILLASPRPQSLQILAEWLAEDAQADLILAPLSATFPQPPPPEPVKEEKPTGGH